MVAVEEDTPPFDTMYGNTDDETVTPMQAIRRFCWDCMGGHGPVELEGGVKMKAYRPYKEVKGCNSTTCWLHPYRTGRRAKK